MAKLPKTAPSGLQDGRAMGYLEVRPLKIYIYVF